MQPTSPDAIDVPAAVLYVSDGRPPTDAGPVDEPGRARLNVTFVDREPETPDPDGSAPVGVVTIGDVLGDSIDGSDDPAPDVTETVVDPTDIEAIGVTISQICEQWDREGHPVTVTFDSLDELLDYTPVETVFRFVHVLTREFASLGVHAWFYFDPDSQPDRVQNVFTQLVDAIVVEKSDSEPHPEATDEEIAALYEDWEAEGSELF